MAGIWTGGGDTGDTSLGDGSRVRKDDERVEAYGTMDEAASAIGVARAAGPGTELDPLLAFAQQRLMNLSAHLASPYGSVPAPSAEDTAVLEAATDRLIRAAGGFRGFTLPGGGEVAARLHVARAIVRRSERRLVTLAGLEDVAPSALTFVNRLSDTLYAAARFANAEAGIDEETWDAGFEPPRA